MYIPVSVQTLQEANAKAGEMGKRCVMETLGKDKGTGESGKRYLT